jgi:nucleotide-binding universal stress UspA family protein
MAQRIVVAVDGSVHAERALDTAIAWARCSGAQLVLVSVVPFHAVPFGGPQVVPPINEVEVEAHRKMLERLAEHAMKSGIPNTVTELLQGMVIDELLEFISQDPPSLLVVGSRGLSAAKRIILGSVSESLVHSAPCPVLVDKPHGVDPRAKLHAPD